HEFELMFKTKDLEKVMSHFQEKLIVTRGSDGVCFYQENKLIQIQSIKVDVVDTTGAGDTFNGALAYGLVNGKTLIEAVELANKAAAISVTKFGAQGGMPTLREIELI
ncbi:MAG: PfkB family carbohydrate kinase, partial [Clostridiales bacterium]